MVSIKNNSVVYFFKECDLKFRYRVYNIMFIIDSLFL